MNKPLFTTIMIILILAGGILLLNQNQTTDIEKTTPTKTSNSLSTTETKTFILTGENFKFVLNGENNPDIKIKEGDKIRIEFTSASGFHDFVIDEFNAATEQVRDGSSTFVEFIAGKKGTFEYYCSVGQHRANGMKGNLIIE
jgi:heme/copper-type cytochrome/quinol oxidase subunit 2